MAIETNSIPNDTLNGLSPWSEKPARILLVEDDPVFATLFKRLATQAHLSVTCVESLSELTDLNHLKYDAAIVDYDLGTENGVETVRYLERYLGDFPALLVSAFQPQVPQAYWPHSIRHFLHKSVGVKAILNTLSHTMDQENTKS